MLPTVLNDKFLLRFSPHALPKIKKMIIMTACLLSSIPTFAGTTTVKTVNPSTQLIQLLSGIKTMQADFTQSTKSSQKFKAKVGQALRSSTLGDTFKGTMQVKRPGYFRWETTAPMNQLVMSNGNTVWIYDPDLSQATRQSVDAQMGNTPALLLSGQVSQINQHFKTTQNPKNANEFTLYPTAKDGLFESLTIRFENKQPVFMQLADSLGQQTQISFSKIKLNGTIADSQFKFTPPKGVDIIDQ